VASLGGDPALWEIQLEKALSESGVLMVPQDRISLLYSLAKLRLVTDKGLSREKGEAALETWREILKDDPVYRAAEEAGGLEGYYNAVVAKIAPVTLRTATGPSLTENLKSLDRLLYLYRHRVSFSLEAHQEIAQLSLENRAYKKAAAHAAFALVAIFSTVIEEVRVYYPDYVFRSLSEIFVNTGTDVYLGAITSADSTSFSAGAPTATALRRWEPVWQFLVSSRTARTFETLIRALDALGEPQAASDIRAWQEKILTAHQGIWRG
jgi:hypothetical protein